MGERQLTPKCATEYVAGPSGYVPGRTAISQRGYSDYAWYRLRVRVEQTSGPLSLLMPLEVDALFAVELQRLHNSTLSLVSDGVVEAKNGRKELFGFERVRAISTQPAHAMADAAKQFGQDDIPVVTIQRAPVPAYA